MNASSSRTGMRAIEAAVRPSRLPRSRIHLATGCAYRPSLSATLASTNSSSSTDLKIRSRSFFSLPDITKLAGLIPGQDGSLPNSLSNSASPDSGSESGSGVQVDGEEQRFHARKILPYSQEQLYSLVSDVPSYSSFIPFCNSSTVLAPSSSASSASARTLEVGQNGGREWKDWTPGNQPFEVLAELAVGFGGLEERYISKVVGKPYESVTATASKQTPLFKSLITTWSFTPASTISPHPSSSAAPSSPSDSTAIREPNSLSPPDPKVGPTLLTIDLAFNFANPLHRIASQAVLPKVADKMVEAFEKRCLEVWGQGRS